ncbi:MAG: queuosine precursor transporter [Gammaproteobacteria bacterium]|nr:queuosine precursor transporter [Gammaproteobacteria bacterium]
MMLQEIKPGFRYLWLLMLAYVMSLAFANWFDPRLIKLFGIVTDAGTLIFPLSYIASDLITEVYGYKHARRAIWTGFMFNLLFIVYGFLVTHMPSPSYAKINVAFDRIIGMDARIIAASIVSYFVAEPLNSLIMAKFKILTEGRLLWFRFLFSTFVASFFDSAIFGSIAFIGIISSSALIQLIIDMWLIKVVIEAVMLPISTRLAPWLKLKEKMDIFDQRTKFTLFSLDDSYCVEDNRFK